jgi:hypothetical protein
MNKQDVKEYNQNNKYKPNNGSHFNLKDAMMVHIKQDWYDEAITFGSKTGDTNGFIVMLKGA